MNCKISDSPLVSIIIPVFNGSNYMKEAIDSAIAQSYENIEILVINDGSNDCGKTREIALSYGNAIRYFEKENGGVSSALNLGIKEMKGEYFSWLSHDDVYKKNKIAEQVKILEKVPHSKCIAMCRMEFIDKNSNYIGKPKIHKDRIYGEEIPWNKALEWHIKVGSFGGCNLLIPKSAFDECGLFDESLRYVQDFLMWLKIFSEGYSLICSEDYNVLNRVHDQQLTQRGKVTFKKESKIASVYIIPKLNDLSRKNQDLLLTYLMYNAKYGNHEVVMNGLRSKKYPTRLTIKMCFVLLYGSIRPYIKCLYYKITKR